MLIPPKWRFGKKPNPKSNEQKKNQYCFCTASLIIHLKLNATYNNDDYGLGMAQTTLTLHAQYNTRLRLALRNDHDV